MLEGVAMRFYTRSTPESDSEAAKSERHSSPNKSRGKSKKRCCQSGERRGRNLCNCCMSQLDQEELSMLPTPATVIATMYDELAWKS
jgi:hypothetical protein